jgi:hypothetical protein
MSLLVLFGQWPACSSSPSPSISTIRTHQHSPGHEQWAPCAPVCSDQTHAFGACVSQELVPLPLLATISMQTRSCITS